MIGINYVGKMKERLANQMFQYAAVKGIAANRGFNYCVPPSNYKNKSDEWNEHQLFVPFELSGDQNHVDLRIRKAVQVLQKKRLSCRPVVQRKGATRRFSYRSAFPK